MSIDKEEPGGSVGTENRITVTYEANNVGETNFRDGEITLTSVGGSGDAVTHVISLTQLPNRETVRVKTISGEGLDRCCFLVQVARSWRICLGAGRRISMMLDHFLRIISTTDEQVVMEYISER